MNLLSLIVAALLGLLLIVFSLLLFAAIIFNLGVGKRYRRGLAQELDRLRLAKMLSALGVDVDSYLHGERIVDIRDQMDRCAACGQTQECDDRLAGGKLDSGQIGFCDNESALQKLVEKEKRSAATRQ